MDCTQFLGRNRPPRDPARSSVTLARRRKIRTLSKLQRKLLRSPFRFQNCTKTAKYEAFGEKCRLQPQIAVSSAISSTVIHLEGLSLLGIFGLVDRARQQTAQVDGGESVRLIGFRNRS